MFFDHGLEFECQKCLYCCSVEPGFVYLSRKDLDRLVSSTDLSEKEFINTYCRYVDMGDCYYIALKEKENYDCIFLSDNGCKVYSARPLQCRTYPFWPSIIRSKEAWNDEKKCCPGIGKGKTVDKEHILECLSMSMENSLLKIKK